MKPEVWIGTSWKMDKTLSEARIFTDRQEIFDPQGLSAGNVAAIDAIDAKYNTR